MTSTNEHDQAPVVPSGAHPYEAAEWLIRRHPWAREAVAGVIGRDPLADAPAVWMDELADVWTATRAHEAAWDAYEHEHPEPDDDDEETWRAWAAAGPTTSPARFVTTNHERIARLLTTLHPTKQPEWAVRDLFGLTEWQIPFVLDWVRIVLSTTSSTPTAVAALAALTPPR